jgi:hypothetical protein
MEYKITATYKTSMVQEFSLDWNGFNFLVIYGKHINGWFIAIPNWGVSTESGEPSDKYYNATKLAQTYRLQNESPSILAEAIMQHWDSYSTLKKE